MVGNMISETNSESLRAISEVILAEEGREVSADEALRRVLEFYHRFVPYG